MSAMEIDTAPVDMPGSNLMWIEKHRPQGLEDLLSHQDIIQTLIKLIDGHKLPHLLFYGPPGTGKTSTILACARRMYGGGENGKEKGQISNNANMYSSMVLELNASDDRGIDVIREQIKSFVSSRILNTSFASSGTPAPSVKLVILDEADAMTSAAQMALRRVVEQYSATTRFCLICNYVNKIIPALQSRCTKFRFGPLQPADVKLRLADIAKDEGLEITDGGLDALVILGEGDMRKSLNIMQSTSMSMGSAMGHGPDPKMTVITKEAVYGNIGYPLPEIIEQMTHWLLNLPFDECLCKMELVKTEQGLALTDIIRQTHEFVLRIHMPVTAKCFILVQMAEIESRLAKGASERLNLMALVGAFKFTAQYALDETK